MTETNGVARKRIYGRRISRPDEAVDAIESMIVENGWPAGHKLPSQRTLAEQLGFSRPTVREALVAMETMGRVEIKPGKGVFLLGRSSCAPTHDSWSEHLTLSGRESQMYQFRYAIEPVIAGLVALNATAAQIEDMGVAVKAMRLAMDKKDQAEFERLDFIFHSLLIEAANNRFFIEAISPFLGLFFESQKLPLSFDDSIEDTVYEHEEIMVHIRARRSKEARAAMERHVRAVVKRAGIRLID
jgi:GntR family transcriptional repressor for pyruvate dehydrogenase complex